MSDQARENRINVLKLTLALAPTPESRYRAWRNLQAEIARRSEQQVERMERAQGLR